MTTPETPTGPVAETTEVRRGRGRPSIGTWKGLLTLPDDMLALVERYKDREKLAKRQDAFRSLISWRARESWVDSSILNSTLEWLSESWLRDASVSGTPRISAWVATPGDWPRGF